ncbi:MAG: tyrosine-protein phosphatase [Acidobacteriota bacterium]
MRCLEWVIPKILAASARPGRELGEEPVPKEIVDTWLAKVRDMSIKSIICLLDSKHLGLYDSLDAGLIEYYSNCGFSVYHCPIKDPAYYRGGQAELGQNLARLWKIYNTLPKPVLVHCSAGEDRTGRVIEYLQDRISERESSVMFVQK